MATGLILIADGSASGASATQSRLESGGFEVIVALDGVAAIAELHGNEIDLVILDLDIRGRDAFDVIKAARHLSPDTEVIVVAERPELATTLECLRLGVFDLVQKPATSLALIVERALERRRLRATTSLYRASNEIFATHDPEKLAPTIVDIAAQIMEADDVALALVTRDGRTMQTLHSRSVSPEVREIVSREVGDDVATAVAALGTPALLPNDDDGSRARLVGVRSSIVFPITAGDRRVGVLTLSRIGDPRPYRRADLERTSVLATQILLAVENASLVRRTIDTERLASIGQLAAGVAHEINNPLMYVLASSVHASEQIAKLRENADKTDADSIAARLTILNEAAEALSDVHDGGERIDAIARDLRTLARGNAPSREAVDLGAAIRSAARIAGARVRETARLQLELGENTTISGHVGRLTQIFLNLMINAAQAGVGLRRVVTIVVKTERVDDRVVATVTDDGVGIDPEHLDLLFKPFFSTKSSVLGTGLGLSLTQNIVAEHSGTIHVSSELGKGATFTVSFPAVLAKSRAA